PSRSTACHWRSATAAAARRSWCGLQQLEERVEVVGALLQHAVEALAARLGALHVSEPAAPDGGDHAVGLALLEQLERASEDLSGALGDLAVLAHREFVVDAARRAVNVRGRL